MKIHRDRRIDAAGRQRTARRFAVGRRSRLARRAGKAGPGSPVEPADAASRLLRPITATSGPKCEP
jgi:hypothetical protein